MTISLTKERLFPDYALVFRCQPDPNNPEKPSAADSERFAALAGKLAQFSIETTARPGVGATVIVLARGNDSAVLRAFRKNEYKDYLQGVSYRIPGRATSAASASASASASDSASAASLSPADRLRIVYELITSPDYANIQPGIGPWEQIEDIFPLHDKHAVDAWVKKWSTKASIDDDDILELRSFYGEKIAMYFVFLRFYFKWSVLLAVVGALCHFLLGDYSVLFTVLTGLWSITMGCMWDRAEQATAVAWGVHGTSDTRRRPGFRFRQNRRDAVTGESKPYYPKWRRLLKEFAFLPAALASGACLMAYQTLVFVIEIFITEFYNGPFKQYLSFLPTVLLSVFVPVMTTVYRRISGKYSDWENHETVETHERSTCRKMFVFNFLTAYMGLFLTSYVYLPYARLLAPRVGYIREIVVPFLGEANVRSEAYAVNHERLRTQVIYFAATAQVISLMLQTVVPYILRVGVSKAKEISAGVVVYADEPEEAQALRDIRSQTELQVYDVNDDYREMIIQYGYLVLFGPVFSLTPVADAVYNFVQLRTDALKICMESKRPVPQRVDSIAPWKGNMLFLSWLGSIVSASVTAMYRDLHLAGPNELELVKIQPWVLLGVILVSEHLYFLLRECISLIVQSFETKAVQEARREEYMVRREYAMNAMAQSDYLLAADEAEAEKIDIAPAVAAFAAAKFGKASQQKEEKKEGKKDL